MGSSLPAPPRTTGTIYRVSVQRRDHAWSAQIAGRRGPGPDVPFPWLERYLARDLADVEPKARKLIWGCTGEAGFEVKVDVQLPPVIEDRLAVISQHCADIETEYDTAISELVEMGLSLFDVSRVLELHHRQPRPLTVANAELAEHGLDRHPGAVGLVWDDHGQFETRKCREHVQATRSEYRDLPADGENALVYESAGFSCDFCEDNQDNEERAECG